MSGVSGNTEFKVPYRNEITVSAVDAVGSENYPVNVADARVFDNTLQKADNVFTI
jgi:hypothetical protein